MKRTGRKHRHLEQRPQTATPPAAAPRPRPSLIELAVCIIVTVIALYFLNRVNDPAQRDCAAQSGKLVKNRWGVPRCVVPGEPAPP